MAKRPKQSSGEPSAGRRSGRATERSAATGARRPAAPSRRGAVTTPWGPAAVVEEVAVAQRVGDRRFGSVLQLLEDGRGRPLVRLAYTTGGAVRRGPVTLRPQDLDALRAALGPGSALAGLLGWPVPDRSGGGA